MAALANLKANIAAGALTIVPVEWADVVGVAERLSAQHTREKGDRAFDIPARRHRAPSRRP